MGLVLCMISFSDAGRRPGAPATTLFARKPFCLAREGCSRALALDDKRGEPWSVANWNWDLQNPAGLKPARATRAPFETRQLVVRADAGSRQ